MTTALERIHEVYDSLPKINCKGLCWNSCGPIDMSDAERARTVELGVDIPLFTAERSQRWAANERLYCPALTHAVEDVAVGCAIYADRPLICRLWGLSETMRCPHGCEPERELTDVETMALVVQVMRIGGHEGLDLDNGPDMAAMLEDPEIGPLAKRLIRGDVSVIPDLDRALGRTRG